MADELDDIDVPKKSKLPLILGALTTLILGGAGGFAGATLLAPSAEAGVADDGEELAEGEDGEAAVPEVERAVIPIGLMTVNLRGTGGGRVLRMEVQVETAAENQMAIEDRLPVVQDAIITLVSDYTYADIEGLDGKTRLRDELLGRINTVLGTIRIDRIYFTQFVVQ